MCATAWSLFFVLQILVSQFFCNDIIFDFDGIIADEFHQCREAFVGADICGVVFVQDVDVVGVPGAFDGVLHGTFDTLFALLVFFHDGASQVDVRVLHVIVDGVHQVIKALVLWVDADKLHFTLDALDYEVFHLGW